VKVKTMEASAKAQPPKPKKRSWWISTNHVVHCYVSPAADCIVTGLWETATEAATSFHDAALERATGEINAILAKVRDQGEGERNLSFIVFESRPFLVWTVPSETGPDEAGTIGPGSDPDTVVKALGLTARKPPKPSRSWILGPITKKIYCFKSPAGDCLVQGLWEASAGEATSFHDAVLAGATSEINTILAGVNNEGGDSRVLGFIVVAGRPFLVWTDAGSVGPEDDLDVIGEALGLKDYR
jgi:hypothetical protein